MKRRAKIIVSPTPEDVAAQVGLLFVRLAENARFDHERFSLALSGGNTPRLLYELLSSAQYQSALDWSNINIFFVDERCVPPDHRDSNFRLAKETFISHGAIRSENVHRIQGEIDPDMAAAEYEQELREFFSGKQDARFDLVLLGLGTDGHTASLFPHTEALNESERWVAANWVEKLNAYRITMTSNLINRAANVAFVVTGAEKAEIVQAVLDGPDNPHEMPAQLINPSNGALTWFLDRAAAGLLN